MFSNFIPLLDRRIEVENEPQPAMKACHPNHADLEKKCAELEEELAAFKEGRHSDSPTRLCYSAYSKLQSDHDKLEEEYACYKEDSEKTISEKNSRIEQLRDDLLDHIFNVEAGSAEEKARIKERITVLEGMVEDGEALEKENATLKAEKTELQSKLRRYQGMERKIESDRKEKTEKDCEYAALWSACEMLGEHVVHATNKLNSQSAKKPNYANEVQKLQGRNSELEIENQDLKLKTGNAILDLSTKMEEIIEKIVHGFRYRFGERVRFTRTKFILLCGELAGNAMTIREHGVMPLQRLAEDLEQEGEQAREKVKLYQKEVDRIFGGIFGGECLNDDKSSGETSTQGDEPQIFTPDTDSPLIREDLEPDNLYDPKPTTSSEPIPTPSSSSSGNSTSEEDIDIRCCIENVEYE